MRTKYIVLVALQALLLVGMIGMREVWIARGERIRLKTVPVDPRDIFRGDYARLSYGISSLNLDEFGCKDPIRKNNKVYVSLKKGEKDLFEAASVTSSKPASGLFIMGRAKHDSYSNSKWDVRLRDEAGTERSFKPQFFHGIKKGDTATFCIDKQGNIINFFKENAEYPQKCYGEGTTTVKGTVEEIVETKYQMVTVEYGIESYFVEEGSGRVIETAPRSQEVVVEVSLNKKGQGLITGLYLDGKRY